MVRATYIWDPEKKKVVPKSEYRRREIDVNAPMIMKDIEAFISPIDRTEIIGRKSLRDHNARHDVVDTREFSESGYWDECAKKREDFFTGDKAGRQGRIDSIIQAIDNQRRTK